MNDTTQQLICMASGWAWRYPGPGRRHDRLPDPEFPHHNNFPLFFTHRLFLHGRPSNRHLYLGLLVHDTGAEARSMCLCTQQAIMFKWASLLSLLKLSHQGQTWFLGTNMTCRIFDDTYSLEYQLSPHSPPFESFFIFSYCIFLATSSSPEYEDPDPTRHD